jgi:hypothetical protein
MLESALAWIVDGLDGTHGWVVQVGLLIALCAMCFTGCLVN